MKKYITTLQLIFTYGILLGCHFLNTNGEPWAYSGIAYGLCGLLWIFHPVKSGKTEATKEQLNTTRWLVGGVFLLLAFFSRSIY